MSQGSKERSFPGRTFILLIILVCLALLISTGLSFQTLWHMRITYLNNRGHDIANAILDRAKWTDFPRDMDSWQHILEEALEVYDESLAFLTILDPSGGILASAGGPLLDRQVSSGKIIKLQDTDVFLLNVEIPPPPPPPPQDGFQGDAPPPWHRPPPIAVASIQIGLHTSPAAFISRQAYVQLAVAVAALLTIFGLSFYFLRTMRRFIDLQAKEESQRHLTVLGGLAATLAHEIRNPLGAMKGLTQVAKEKLPAEHDAQQMMNTVVVEAERLENLVTNLLTFAKPPEPRFQRVDLNGLIKDLKAALEPQFKESGVSLITDLNEKHPVISSDADGLRQILINVILNALEATAPGGMVKVVLLPEGGKKWIHLEVLDNGKGLEGQSPEALFQPFTTTKLKGSGLGLAISKQIVECIGGEIKLTNRTGNGARCVITLPAGAANHLR